LRSPAAFRVYRAIAAVRFVLGKGDQRLPVKADAASRGPDGGEAER
jgi:hypothetical protein